MKTTTLQIPMQTTLRNRATKVAHKQGFSSLQELVRVFLIQLGNGLWEVEFRIPNIEPSTKNEAHYDKMLKEAKSE